MLDIDKINASISKLVLMSNNALAESDALTTFINDIIPSTEPEMYINKPSTVVDLKGFDRSQKRLAYLSKSVLENSAEIERLARLLPPTTLTQQEIDDIISQSNYVMSDFTHVGLSAFDNLMLQNFTQGN